MKDTLHRHGALRCLGLVPKHEDSSSISYGSQLIMEDPKMKTLDNFKEHPQWHVLLDHLSPSSN
jgi:hypothetical protein